MRLLSVLFVSATAAVAQFACHGDAPSPAEETSSGVQPPPAQPGPQEDRDTDGDEKDDDDEEELAFPEARLLIEHNASAEDTGFQGFVDGDPWKRLDIVGPDETVVLSVSARGSLRDLGLTELFFETQEPANAEVPIADVLARLPEGTYEFEGRDIEGNEVEGEATLTHAIPAGPEIVTPAEASVVDPRAAVVDWEPVTETIAGDPVDIVGYELIVEKDVDQPGLPGFSKTLLSIHVPAEVTSLTIPPEFLQPATAYKFEVLALEVGGNQTITESSFETAK
jgi:hypothetical protein